MKQGRASALPCFRKGDNMAKKKQLVENLVHGLFLLLGLITVGCVLLLSLIHI